MRPGCHARLAVMGLVFAGLARAQFNCTIQGIVTDPSGAVIADAAVHVKNVETGLVRDVTTSSDGIYRVLSLGPGTYEAQVQATGFRPMSRTGIVVGITETARVDFSLQLGATAETVEVTSGTTEVETEKSAYSNVITPREIHDIPVNGSNVFAMLALQPGITGRAFTYAGGVDANASFGSHPSVNINASGGRADGNSFMVDGASVSGVADGGTVVIQPNPDSVEELRINSNTYSAEYGRNSGAQVEVITKGGTNQFHGGAFEEFQNNTLSSRNEFEARTSVFRRNQFGYNLGGPIKKNRLFFFTSYDGLRASGGRAVSATVETQALANYIEQKYPNTIAAKLFSQFAPVSYATYNLRDLGSPITSPSSLGPADGIMDIGSINYVPNTIRYGNQFSGRVDYDLRPSKDRLFVNYYNMHSEQLGGGARPAFDRPEDDFDELLSMNVTHIFSPTKINEFKFGLNRTAAGSVYPNHLEVPTITVSGITGFGLTGQFPAGWYQTEFTYKDALSWIHSSHSFKFGAEVRREWGNSHQTTTYVPNYTFNNVLNFALDQPATEVQLVDPRTGIPGTLVLGLRALDLGFFFNDDWKVTRNLTISYGVRYERFGTWTEVNNLLRNMVLGTGSSFTEQLSNASMQFVKQLYATPGKNFMPRFGFAWNPDGKGKTSVRGGYGIYFDRIYSTPIINIRSNPPYRALATSGYQYGTQVYYSLGNPSAPNLGFPIDPDWQLGLDAHNGIKGSRVGLLQIVDPNLSEPYTENWFLGVQRDLGHGIVLEATYLGSAGHHLLNTLDINRFNGDLLRGGQFHGYNQSFAAMPIAETTSNSIYNGGTVQARRAFKRGFSMQGAFTYGKAIDDADKFGGITPYVDVNNRRLDRALAGFDVPRRLSMAGIWALPFFRQPNRLSGKMLGGWQLSGTTILEKGTPLSVTSTATYPKGDWNADGTANDRPNAPATPLPTSGYERSAYLTGFLQASAFSAPASGTDGTLGRNTYRGPGFAQVDLSLSKNFAFTEHRFLQFRVNAYNAFNRVNLNNPVVDLNNSNFGRSTAQQTPRAVEGVLRFTF
jgi:hypothetical protein